MTILQRLHSNKGLIFVSLGNLLGAALTGAFWFILASIQNAEDYGKINYEFALASFATFGALLGLNTTITTYIAKGSGNIHSQASQIVLFSGIIAAIIVATIGRSWILGLFVLSMAFWMMGSYELLGRRMYKQYAVVVIGARALQLVLAIGLYYWIGLPGIIIGFSLSFLLFSHRYFISLKSSLNSLLSHPLKAFREIAEKRRFVGHAYSFTMSYACLMYFDKLVVAPLFGYAVLGYYQLAIQFLLFIGMIPLSFYQYLLSEESSGYKQGRLRLTGYILSAILAATLFFASPFIVNEFFPNFLGSLDAIRITSFGIVPLTVILVLNSKLFSAEKTVFVLFGSIIYLLIQTVLFLLLGNEMGATGLAVAVDVALAAQAVFLLLVASRKVPTTIPATTGGG